MFPHYSSQNLLFAELLHKFVYIEGLPNVIFPILSILLIWLIAKSFFKKGLAFIPILIFILSPWGWYLVIAHSFYLLHLLLTLAVVYGIILINSERLASGSIFVTLACTLTIYSSSIFLVIIPLSFIVLIISKVVNFKDFKITIISLLLLTLPLLFLIGNNKSVFQDSISRDIKIFSDPGLINSINRYQGAAQAIGFRNLARISENKYLFYSEYFVLKYVSQLTPNTFFTPQYKLLGFSFSPPILLGFIIPFIYGLYRLLNNSLTRKYMLVSTILVIPSVLANDLVSLNRLVLFLPAIILTISFGLIYMYKIRADKISKIFLTLTLVLIVLQMTVVINDIRFREMPRFNQYYGQKYELPEP